MDFDSEHKAILSTLDKGEARAFLTFLNVERLRHEHDRTAALEYHTRNKRKWPALSQLWESEALRHAEDLQQIDDLQQQVQSKFNL